MGRRLGKARCWVAVATVYPWEPWASAMGTSRMMSHTEYHLHGKSGSVFSLHSAQWLRWAGRLDSANNNNNNNARKRDRNLASSSSTCYLGFPTHINICYENAYTFIIRALSPKSIKKDSKMRY